MVIKSDSAAETKRVAAELAKKFQEKGGIFALTGDLGAGKTTFVQGFAKGLGIKDKIISPTFVLIRQHSLKSGQTLYHVDLYRLPDNPNIDDLGLLDLFSEKGALVLIEWADKISTKLPKETISIDIQKPTENDRVINVSGDLPH